MANKKLNEEIRQLGILKSLVRVTGEIASGRMHKARDGVLYRRDYLKQLTDVFTQAHRSYLRQKGREDATEKVTRFTTLAHNGKTVAVFLSANTRLYGDLLTRTFNKFYEDVSTSGSEATIVGEVGRSMLKARKEDVPITFFKMQDEKIEEEELKKLVQHLAPYEEIHVYYGKYINPVRQEAEAYTISSELNTVEEKEGEPVVDYLYEPTLEKVLQFFETQIFKTMFEQTIVESRLAKYAARFVAMDRAEQQIDKTIDKTTMKMRMMKHRESNKKQLNLMGPVVVRFNGRGA